MPFKFGPICVRQMCTKNSNIKYCLYDTDIDALRPYAYCIAKYEIDTCPDEAVTFDPCLKKSE